MKSSAKTRAVCNAEYVTMSHGGGGKDMRDLIEDVFVASFDNPELNCLEDQARFDLNSFIACGDRLAFTTDSYVVDPLFFPGGNIGTLAVNGTINDLAVSGAIPKHLSCSMIIEEGFPVKTLREIAASMKKAADEAGVSIVTGDTKVVEKRAADKLFINTAGIGIIPQGINISARKAQPGDRVLVNAQLGDHGAAILSARSDLALECTIQSDCRSLAGLVAAMLKSCPELHCMRDATRGGVATVLAEFAEASCVRIEIDEAKLPVREEVRGLCEILGLDPLYLANEGTMILIVSAEQADSLLEVMKQHEYGTHAAIIGEVKETADPCVVLRTSMGGQRLMDRLSGLQLPRIC